MTDVHDGYKNVNYLNEDDISYIIEALCTD